MRKQSPNRLLEKLEAAGTFQWSWGVLGVAGGDQGRERKTFSLSVFLFF